MTVWEVEIDLADRLICLVELESLSGSRCRDSRQRKDLFQGDH